MNQYESFKLEFMLRIIDQGMPQEYTDLVSREIDFVAKDYHIERLSTDIIVSGEEMPAAVKLFLASKYVENKSKETLYEYKLTLKNFFKMVQKPLPDITSNDIRVFIYRYVQERKVSNSTMDTMRHTLNSFFSWCYAEDYISKDPMRRIPKINFPEPELPPLDPVELEMVRGACKNIREKAIVDFLFSTGCRVSEMCNVKKEDIDIQNRNVFITKGKGGKKRRTYLNPEAVISLQKYLESRKDNYDYLFTHSKDLHRDGKMGKRAVEMLLHKIVARCPEIIKNVTPHTFRRTAGTTASDNGMPIEQVKEFLGHSNINTTLRYAKVNKTEVKRSHEKYVR